MKSIKHALEGFVEERCPVAYRPFACSFDLRLGREKCFVVDGNFFPTGWHHLPFPSPDSWKENRARVKTFFGWQTEEAIAVVPELQLQNEDYLKNLVWLHNFYTCAGFRTFVVPLPESGSIPKKLVLDHIRGPCHGNPLEYCPFEVRDHQLWVEGIPVGFALSQYDGSKSTLVLKSPETGHDVDIRFFPPHECNWQYRRKHRFFEAYHRFVTEAQRSLSVDLSSFCFGFDHLALDKTAPSVMDQWGSVSDWVSAVAVDKGTDEYYILKSDHGTYGLGVEVVHGGEDLRRWSSRRIKQFRHGRFQAPILGLVLQEGLATDVFVGDRAAERVDYYFLGKRYGSFFRMHERKESQGNLNRKGAAFGQATIPSEQSEKLDIASLLAFGGICFEYRGILENKTRQ